MVAVTPQADRRMDVTFCSFNIRYDNRRDGRNRWSRRRQQVYRMWLRDMWDVVGLQEALHSQMVDLRQALPQYGVVGVGRDDGATMGEHCPIFYRRDRFEVMRSGTFWLSDNPDNAGEIGWGAAHPRICTWAELRAPTDSPPCRFTVYNTHTDNASQLARERGVALILRRIAAASAVLMGDFNATDDNPALTAIRSAAMVNTHPAGDDTGTYHGFTGGNKEGKIDHIFATPDWHIDASSIVTEHTGRRYPSDHYPVVAALHLT